jgi:hypothetical protein
MIPLITLTLLLDTNNSGALSTSLFRSITTPIIDSIPYDLLVVIPSHTCYRYSGFNDTSVMTVDYFVSTLQEYQNGAWGGSGNTVGWIQVPELFFYSPVNASSHIPAGPVM